VGSFPIFFFNFVEEPKDLKSNYFKEVINLRDEKWLKI